MRLSGSCLCWGGGHSHASMLRSGVVLIISSCNLWNAFSSSPYKRGMFTSNRPLSAQYKVSENHCNTHIQGFTYSKQYAISSIRVVSRVDAHDILVATGMDIKQSRFERMLFGILVMSLSSTDNESLDPMQSHTELKNNMLLGAINSCNVQPRVNLLALSQN
jgi:hypothetical protein